MNFFRRVLLPGLALTALFGFADAVLPSRASAQALPAAYKKMDVSAFGGYLRVNPDYGQVHNSGETFGLNITRYFHFPVAPSLEARVNLSHGDVVNEKTYLFGLRGQSQYKRFHPYADFLVGIGNIHYNFPARTILGDNSNVYSYGGGVDIDAYRNFSLKVDYQGQHWKTGRDVTLTPSALMIGVSYHIPFKDYKTQQTIGR